MAKTACDATRRGRSVRPIRPAHRRDGLLLGFFYSLPNTYESTEHRVAQAGYPVGTVAATRAHADRGENAARQLRYEEKWRRIG